MFTLVCRKGTVIFAKNGTRHLKFYLFHRYSFHKEVINYANNILLVKELPNFFT